MKLINQSYEILTEKNPLKLIELAGRTCYKSEGKITEDSASDFVKMLVKRGHLSVIEHAHIAFEVPHLTLHARFFTYSFEDNRVVMSGNFRAWKELLENPDVLNMPSYNGIAHRLHWQYPEIFPGAAGTFTQAVSTPYPRDSPHRPITVRFITNRGVTHEIVRHRLCAFSQESTRYVRYDGNMEFITPVWFSLGYQMSHGGKDAVRNFKRGLLRAEELYIDLLESGWKPEQAREVLPNALKSEIVVTATRRQWAHIFEQRCSPRAHPQMRALMIPLREEMNDL